MAEFKDRFYEALVMNRMKCVDLYEALGIPKSTLSNYTSGRMIPKQKRMEQIAMFLNVDVQWLMGYGDEKKSDSDLIMEQEYKLLSEEQKSVVRSLVHTLAVQNIQEKNA